MWMLFTRSCVISIQSLKRSPCPARALTPSRPSMMSFAMSTSRTIVPRSVPRFGARPFRQPAAQGSSMVPSR